MVSPSAALVLVVLVRNYWLAGKLAGGLRGDEGNSTSAVLQSVYWSVSEVSGFSKAGLLRGDLPEWVLVLFVVSTLGCLTLGLRLTVNWSVLRAPGPQSHAWLALVYVAGTLGAIMIAAKAHASGVVSSRYLVPLVPFALLLVASGLDLIHCDPRSRRQRTMAAALRWGAFAVFLVGQVNVAGYQRLGAFMLCTLVFWMRNLFGVGVVLVWGMALIALASKGIGNAPRFLTPAGRPGSPPPGQRGAADGSGAGQAGGGAARPRVHAHDLD